jgi:Ca-activated chloride channel homolog
VSFVEPRLLWLCLLGPLVAAAAAGLWRRRLAADAAWAARGLWRRLLPAYHPRRLALSVVLLAVAVLGTALALARPRWGATEQKVERRGVDVVFLVDTSLSMAAFDVRPSRLFVAKALVRRLVGAMPGNRVGLVQTEGTGVALAPLTLDGAVLDLLLDAVTPGSLPTPGTEIASGIEAAVHLFGEEGHKHRALVVLSDGEDHGGGLEAEIDRLKEAGVVVYALGIGTPQGAPVPAAGGDAAEAAAGAPGGGGLAYKRDEDGRVVISRLHEDVLERLARATGGSYLRVVDAGVDPEPILARIDRMEKKSLESETLNTREERFQWPLALAALAIVLYLALGPFAAVREMRA